MPECVNKPLEELAIGEEAPLGGEILSSLGFGFVGRSDCLEELYSWTRWGIEDQSVQAISVPIIKRTDAKTFQVVVRAKALYIGPISSKNRYTCGVQ